MNKLRWSAACLGALTLFVSACGRSDDTDAGSTAAPTAAPADTTAAPATSDGGETTVPGETPVPGDRALTAAEIAEQCASEPLQATEVGVTADTITIEVMADTGSPLAPGLFQANIDAVKAFADHINANGGVGCRQLKVRTWDSKIDATEAKNGQIDACANAVALVGSNALANADVTAMNECKDLSGAATGLPNMAALVQTPEEMCSPMTFTIQYRTEQCPINVGQPRDYTWPIGPVKKMAELAGTDLRGVYLIGGDTPATRQSQIPNIAAQEAVGVTFDAKLLISGRDEQSAYTPRVQFLKDGANYVYDGANDKVLVAMMKEAVAQGVDTSAVTWGCSIACYTSAFLDQGGSAVEGAYMWMQFLPLEETDQNAALAAYVDAVGSKADTFGAQAWQAGIAFQQVVNQIVAEEGPNAITRAKIVAGLEALEGFTADGWAGERNLRSVSPCYVLVQVRDGQFERAWPEERGTMDCDPGNLIPVTAEPVSGAEQLS